MPTNKTIREQIDKLPWNYDPELGEFLSRKGVEKALITQLQEIEDMVEGMEKVDKGECPECRGDGLTAEHDPEDPHENGCSSCPIQVQCEPCQGTGVYEMPDLRYNQALTDIAKALKEKKDKLVTNLSN